jgi:hypothetical protein
MLVRIEAVKRKMEIGYDAVRIRRGTIFKGEGIPSETASP